MINFIKNHRMAVLIFLVLLIICIIIFIDLRSFEINQLPNRIAMLPQDIELAEIEKKFSYELKGMAYATNLFLRWKYPNYEDDLNKILDEKLIELDEETKELNKYYNIKSDGFDGFDELNKRIEEEMIKRGLPILSQYERQEIIVYGKLSAIGKVKFKIFKFYYTNKHAV